MNQPSPALVTQRAVQRLPRWMLLLFCASWVVPGVFGRDPWRNEDAAAFGLMSAIAQGRTSWLEPTLGGLAVAAEPLPHWLGAATIWLLAPVLDIALAARLPFAALLALTLVCTWYACFHLALTSAAQPVAFAFGGEASAVDYARAVADGALLALIACLGLLQLGHETTPELMQLFAVSLGLWAMAAAPQRPQRSRWGSVVALLLLAGSGAPAIAAMLGATGTLISWRARDRAAQALVPWLLAGTVLAAFVAWTFDQWKWSLAFRPDADQVLQIGRQWAWFLWPAWLLALWTLWRWRRQCLQRHVALPAGFALTGIVASVWMGGFDRALMLSLPGLAVLAAFALPTMKRGVTAAIDWFSVCFFTACALFIWAMYIAMQTGTPQQWAANVTKLQPGFEATYSAVALVFATAGSLAWLGLVRWRSGRSQHALWKSLVLPAGGVALCWLLLMTLWLPLLDYARSPRPLIERGIRHIGTVNCVSAPDAPPALVAALEVFGQYRVDARPVEAQRPIACDVRVSFDRIAASVPLPGWRLIASERRNRDASELMSIYRRIDR